ncbi:MAG: ABC transporter permease [Patescibacteria group bacterium]|nr:ABC transporter permease [Patescibacteria group bacterium]
MEQYRKTLVHTLKITMYSMKMFFRDRTAIFFSLFLPILIMSIFGVINFDEEVNVNMAIIDEANNQASEQFINGLSDVEALKIIEAESLDTELQVIEDGNLDMAVVLPKDFGTSVKDQNTRPQEIKTYYNEESATSVSVGTTILNQALDGFTHQVFNVPYLFELKSEPVASKGFSYVDYLIPGVIGMGIMFMSTMGVVGVIVTWREQGILRRLLATPIHPSTIITSQVVTRLTISVLQAFIILGLGILVFDANIMVNLPLTALFVVMGAIIFLSFGFAISGVANSQNTVMALTNIVIMPQLFLSGLFFPRDGFPQILQDVSKYLPLSYLNDALRGVMIDGSTLSALRPEVIGLSVWILVTFFAATKMFRWE